MQHGAVRDDDVGAAKIKGLSACDDSDTACGDGDGVVAKVISYVAAR